MTTRKGIINVQELVPDDIVLGVGGRELRVRGDIEARHAFKISQLLQAAGQSSEEFADLPSFMAAQQALHDYVLGVLQEKTPDLESVPADMRGVAGIASIIMRRAMGASLESLGETSNGEDDAVPPRRKSRSRSTQPGGSPRS